MPDEIERVEGEVEGVILTRDQERAIAEKARDEFLIHPDWEAFGNNDLMDITGALVYFRTARPIGMTHFTSGAELAGACQAFFESLLDFIAHGTNLKPDIELMASFLGVDRATLMSWRKGEGNPEFIPVLNKAWNDIAAVKKQMAMDNKIPMLMYVQDMQNNHGYVSNTTKTDVQIQVRQGISNPTQLIEAAKLLP